MKAYNLETARQHREEITELYLHGLGLAETPALVFELTRLEVLCLSGNQLREIPAEIGSLSRLRDLDASGNQLESLPASLQKLRGLEKVNLAENRISRFPAVLCKLRGLRHLDLSGNRLRSLPGQLVAPGLQELKLSGNRIAELPERWENLRHLRDLDAGRNRLAHIPAWLYSLADLHNLDLSHNRLSEIPVALGGLVSLETLNLAHNRIAAFPESLGGLRNLRRLYLDFNQIEALPVKAGELRSLRIFSFQGNRLAEWPSLLGEAPRLSILELGQNRIAVLPGSPGKWPALERLGLERNGLTALPEALARLPRLRELHLGRNLFSGFPVVLISSASLEIISGVAGAARAIRFLQACRQVDTPETCRRDLFQCWQGKTEPCDLPVYTRWQGLRLPLPSLRKELLSVLFAKAAPPLSPGVVIVGFAGKTRLSRSQWKERLSRFGIATDGIPTHVVIGAGALEFSADWAGKEPAFLEEAALHQQLQGLENAYLHGREDHSPLRALLQSAQEASLRLALALMQGGGVPSPLMTDLYLAWKSAPDSKLKKALRDLLLLHSSEAGRDFLLKTRPFSTSEQLEACCRDTEFDAAAIWRWQTNK